MSRKKPFHPGTILKEMYLDEMELSQADLAERIGCKYAKVNEIVNGKRGITPEFAIDLEKALKIDPNYTDAKKNLKLARSLAARPRFEGNGISRQ